MRESSESWRDLLLDLSVASDNGVADCGPPTARSLLEGAREVWPTTREQRCWVHKTANILNKMPKSLHTRQGARCKEIWMARPRRMR